MPRHQLVTMVMDDLKEVLLDTASRPVTHFSEKSLQIQLSYRLLSRPEFASFHSTGIAEHRKKNLAKICQGEMNSKPNLEEYHNKSYEVRLLQMEYGNNLKGPYRMDLAILDPQDIRKIVHPLSLKDSHKRYLKPLIGVEFFTEKSAQSLKNICRHLSEDAKKVTECQHGFVVNIYRNANWTRRSQPRSANSFAKIEAFQSQVQLAAENFPKLFWIGMSVHIAFGEVSFFTKNHAWQTIGISEGTEELSKAINERFSNN